MLPAVPNGSMSPRSMARWRSVGWRTSAHGWASQPSTMSNASTGPNGSANTEARVDNRTKPSNTDHAKPTGSVPESNDSSHGSARALWGDVLSSAYRRRLTSGSFTDAARACSFPELELAEDFLVFEVGGHLKGVRQVDTRPQAHFS